MPRLDTYTTTKTAGLLRDARGEASYTAAGTINPQTFEYNNKILNKGSAMELQAEFRLVMNGALNDGIIIEVDNIKYKPVITKKTFVATEAYLTRLK